MNEPEELAGLPPFARGVIQGMRAAIRDKWNEAATGFFLRVVTNYQTGEACRVAGFTDASIHFASRSVYYLAQGMYCLGQFEAGGSNARSSNRDKGCQMPELR